jgi:catechol 2,3-dioxygenase-like lactoylglutathione lyase family enzyme
MLQHASQPVRAADAVACIRFYTLLGFQEVEPPGELAGRSRWLERAATQIHLLLEEDPRTGSGHVAVVVDDYEATVAALGAAGHPVQARTRHWGAPRCFTWDPAGNRVEVMAWPPPPGAGARMAP